MTGNLTDEKKFEIAFIIVFSALILIIFYTLISMNGVVLGNDPSVHLKKAQIFLQTGKIPLVNLGWTPPLYELVLTMFMVFSGASGTGQLIFLVKVLSAIIDWLLFLTVYLVGRKFFNVKVAAVAAVVLLMCFPMYEVNMFGGVTTVLALAFLFLLFLFTPQAGEHLSYLVVAFLVAFSLVLSHQLALFIGVFVMIPVLIYMLKKSKGANLKVVVALVLGGGIAFVLYYFQAMIGYIGLFIDYMFFEIKTYAYQIPSVGFNAFMVNFGFIFFLALGGFFISYFIMRKQNKLIYYVTLILSFFVPLFFAESYLIGFYMPFQWFIYYLTPSTAIFAAVAIVFFGEKLLAFYSKNKNGLRKNWVKVATVGLVLLMCVLLVFRSDVVYGKIMEASVFYATSDIKAYDAGVWLQQNYPQNATVVVTQIPGFWFSTFSGKNIIAQTDPVVERNAIAESVLSLSYEFEQPQTMIRAYEAKGDIIDENYVSLDQVWYRDSYCSTQADFVSFSQGGVNYSFPLSDLSRQVAFDEQSSPKQLAFTYSNAYVALTQTLIVQNDSYATNVSWALSPLQSDISNVTLYLTTLFDLQFNFDKAEIPQYMDWVNPWDAPFKTTSGTDWAVAGFTGANLNDNYIGVYDDQKNVALAFKFADLPDWGNIGALGNRQIDAVRFQYQIGEVNLNQTVTRQYQVLTLAKNSYPALTQNTLESLFDYKPAQFTVTSRDYKDYIAANDIGFIVYDKNQLDSNIVRCKFLQLIYSNDRYDIFKILSNYNQP